MQLIRPLAQACHGHAAGCSLLALKGAGGIRNTLAVSKIMKFSYSAKQVHIRAHTTVIGAVGRSQHLPPGMKQWNTR
jgi:hypothetical protein